MKLLIALLIVSIATCGIVRFPLTPAPFKNAAETPGSETETSPESTEETSSTTPPTTETTETPSGTEETPASTALPNGLPVGNYQDVAYTIEIEIGTPKQNFTVVVATALDFLWVTSLSNLTQDYNCSLSSTCTIFEEEEEVRIGGFGPGNGTVYTDTLYLANDTITNISFIGMKAYNFEDPIGVGEVIFGGLGLANFENNSFPMIIQQLYSQGNVASPIFSLRYALTNSTTDGGELILGGIDPNYENSTFAYVPANYTYVWNATVDTFEFGNISLGSVNQEVIFDSATSYIWLPPSIYTQIESHFSLFTLNCTEVGCDCGLISSLPDIVLSMGGNVYTIAPSTYWQVNTEGSCYAYIQNTGAEFFVLGVPFFRQYYSVFDAGQSRVGFTPLLNTTTTIVAATNQTETGAESSETTESSETSSETTGTSTETTETPAATETTETPSSTETPPATETPSGETGATSP